MSKGRMDRDWIRNAHRFMVPLPAVPHADRKDRLANDRDFYAALLMTFAPWERPLDLIDLWRRTDDACRRLEGQ